MRKKIDLSVYKRWLDDPCTQKLFGEVLPSLLKDVESSMISAQLLDHPNMLGKWGELLGKKRMLKDILSYSEVDFVEKTNGENQNG